MDPHSKSYVPSSANNTTTQQEEIPRRKFFFPKSNDQSNTNRNISNNNNNTQIKEKKQIKINVKRNDQPKIREEDNNNKNKNVERKKITIQKRGEEKKIIVEKNHQNNNNNYEDDNDISSEINENISELYKSNENLNNTNNEEKKVVERKKIFIEPRINKNMDLKKHSELSQDIIKKLNNLSYNCMICFERVNRKEQIWHCIYCYRIFHLNCTKKWEQSCKSEEGSQDVWSCPHCRSIFSDPPSFLCYCGKEKKPQFNTYSIVGSCNNLCGKKRKGECPHLCQNSCHPGSCPSCEEIQYKKCFCGKTKYSIGCSEIDDGRSCGEKCSKLLNCGVHYCERLCHMGDCGNCTEIELQVCYCGETEQEKTCGTGELDESSGEERYFSCAAICNQLLSCGKHKCERICHKGECGNCSSDPKYLKKCPCGRTPLEVLLKGKERTSCTDEIPVCDNPCNKMLSCGIHKCKKKCHADKCGPCLSERKIRCRCGGTKMTKQCNEILQQDFVVSGKGKGAQVIPTSDVPRIDSILCNKKCTQNKSCGKHKCNNVCCISNLDKEDLMGIHTCMLPCGKKLNCKKHRCDLICHKGSCSPCLEASFEPRSCPCGKTIQEPPIRCGTAKLNCPYECVFERLCGHSSQNHMSLKHPCHFDNKKCTPCSVLVSVMCWCGKERRNNVPCNQSEGVRCNNKCGKQLSCGIHFCDRVCHRDECQKSEDLIDHPTPPCHQICGIQLEFCEHRCIQKCHPTSDCNVKVCSQTSNIFCECKRKKMSVVCGLGEDEEQNKLLLEQRANMLKCDQECEEQMHKTTLSLAFGKMTSSYVQTLVELAMLHPIFLERIEKVFYNLINRDKLSDVKYAFPPTIAFPPMDSVKRKIIHLLAKTYNLETVSQNEEPNKRVVVKCSSASRVPKLLLSAYVNLKKNPNDKNCFVLGMLITNLTKINLPFPIDNVYLDTYFKYYKGKYEFHWINDDNVLVVFEDNKTLNQALNSVNGLSIMVYNESMNFNGEDRPTPKPRKNYTNSVSITKTTTVIDKEWQQSTQNFYSALKEPSPTTTTTNKDDSEDDGKTDKDDLVETPTNDNINKINNENVSENWEDDLDSQDN